jgi:hypothetical protein
MEVTYKKVVDGIKISTEQAITIYNMCDMVYKTLSTQGTMTQEQLTAYEDLKRVLSEVI